MEEREGDQLCAYVVPTQEEGEDAPVNVEFVPRGHELQVADPGATAYDPRGHIIHALPFTLLNVPGLQISGGEPPPKQEKPDGHAMTDPPEQKEPGSAGHGEVVAVAVIEAVDVDVADDVEDAVAEAEQVPGGADRPVVVHPSQGQGTGSPEPAGQ